MSKITFKKEPVYDTDTTTVTYEFEEVTIHQMMLEYRQFLLSIGFSEAQIDEYIEPA